MISFRPHIREDIPLRVQWLNNPATILFTVEDPNHKTTLAEQSEWFDNYEQKNKRGEKIFFTLLENEKSIGFMGISNIDNKNKTGDVFILIGEDGCRGRGIGNESMLYLIQQAFEQIHLKSLSLWVNKLNAPAIHLYKKLGFREIGEDGKEIQMELVCL